jgi:hypothetical protein
VPLLLDCREVPDEEDAEPELVEPDPELLVSVRPMPIAEHPPTPTSTAAIATEVKYTLRISIPLHGFAFSKAHSKVS